MPPPTCRRRFSSGRLPKSCLGWRHPPHPPNRKCEDGLKIDRCFPWLIGFQGQTKKKNFRTATVVFCDGYIYIHIYYIHIYIYIYILYSYIYIPSESISCNQTNSFPSDANLLNFAVLVVVISSTTAVIASRYSAKSCGRSMWLVSRKIGV